MKHSIIFLIKLFIYSSYLSLGLAPNLRLYAQTGIGTPLTYQNLLASEEQKKLIAQNDKLIQQLLKKDQTDAIVGIELIVAEQSDKRIESQFGHLLLRFVDNDNYPGNDVTLSFVADIHTPRQSAIGGVLGTYAVFPQLKSFRKFVDQYVKQDDRPLHRYIIPTSAKMRQDTIATLHRWWNEYKELRSEVLAHEKERTEKVAQRWANTIYAAAGDIVPVEHEGEFIGWGVVHQDSNTTDGQSSSIDQATLSHQAIGQSAARLHLAVSNDPQLKQHDFTVIAFGPSVQAVVKNNHAYFIPINDLRNHTDKQREITIAKRSLQWKQRPMGSLPIVFSSYNKYGNIEGHTVFYLQKDEPFDAKYQVLKTLPIEPKVEVIKPLRVTTPSMGRYTFFSNNCAGALLNFLKAANLPQLDYRNLEARIPIWAPDFLKKSLLNPYPPTEVNSLYKLKLKLAALLNKDIKAVNQTNWNEVSFKSIEKELSLKEILLFIDGLSKIESNLKLRLIRDYQVDSLKVKSNELYEMEALPLPLYSVCEDKTCTDQLWEILHQQWKANDLNEALDYNRKLALMNKLPASLEVRPELIRHFFLLLR